MNKQVYIAAPWELREVAKDLAEKLEAKGIGVTHPWWVDEGTTADGFTDEDENFLIQCALSDYNGVRKADAFILLNTQARGYETSGKAVETGMALAWGCPIFMIGEPSNIFHHLPNIRKVPNDLDILVAALEAL